MGRVHVRSKWPALPCNVNAGYVSLDSYTYFYKGEYFPQFTDVIINFSKGRFWNAEYVPSTETNCFYLVSLLPATLCPKSSPLIMDGFGMARIAYWRVLRFLQNEGTQLTLDRIFETPSHIFAVLSVLNFD